MSCVCVKFSTPPTAPFTHTHTQCTSTLHNQVLLSAFGRGYLGPAEGSFPPASYQSFGAGLAEVEVDCLTGERRLLRVDLAFDAGRSVSPAIDMGQVRRQAGGEGAQEKSKGRGGGEEGHTAALKWACMPRTIDERVHVNHSGRHARHNYASSVIVCVLLLLLRVVCQVEGAFMWGIGYLTTEEVVEDPATGANLSASTWTYKPPGIAELPQVRLLLSPFPRGVQTRGG